MKKKILKIIGVIFLLILSAVVVMLIIFFRDPGFYLRLVSDKINEDEVVEVYYNYDYEDPSKTKTTPYFYFKPSGSGNYTFSAADIESSDDAYISMTVTNRYLDDYFVADNRDHDVSGRKDTISGSTTLPASQPCYVLFTVEPLDGDLARISGSFKLIVTEDPVDEGPPQLTTDGPVSVTVEPEGKACVAFTPPETGYYRFENSIVSHDSAKGYSSLSSITSSDKVKVGVTSDIALLQKEKEYYVWVTVNETDSRRSEVEISCMPMKTEKANGICSVEIDGDSVIAYVAKKDCDLAVYTVSEGDPSLVIYEQPGFPLRSDDKSEASLSSNPNDVATVLRVKQGTGLHICIFGDVADCRVYITEYTGDGTSLTVDDLVPVPEDKEDVKAEEVPEEEQPEEGQTEDSQP